MREIVKEFVKICDEVLQLREPVYEFGALQVPGQEGFADLRPLFPDRRYVGADLRPGPGVDVLLDLHSLGLPAGSAATVIIVDTLEHVEDPRKAVDEAHRVLDSEGILLVSSHMKFPIHEFPSDYWRFTPEGFRSLLKPFPMSLVGFCGEDDFPEAVLGIGVKGGTAQEQLQTVAERFPLWNRPMPEPDYPRTWRDIVRPLVPPIVLEGFRRIRDRGRAPK